MSISFACECGKTLRVSDEHAGKKARCPQCGAALTIPTPEIDEHDDEGYGLEEPETPAPRAPSVSSYPVDPDPAPSPTRFVASPAGDSFRPAPQDDFGDGPDPGSIREYAYGLLIFALIPLAFSLLTKDDKTFNERLNATLKQATPEQMKQVEAAVAKGEKLTKDELFSVLPGGKLADAHLPHKTTTHWVYAAVATTGFLLLILLMFSVERSHPLHLLGIGLFTGTVGILFLLAVQACSHIRIGRIHGRGIIMVVILFLAFVGWSYHSALDPDSNFFLSAFGFTFGVGLCEELTKALPLFYYYKNHGSMGWRNACLWGLASGIGFGVSEGIMYSANSYNGIGGAGIYVVRFVSCVALHAMWSACVAISIARTLDAYETVEEWAGFSAYALRVLAVPMVLHGFYDTLLKKDMNVWALVVAFASFAWFAAQIERARGAMPEAGARGKVRRFA